MKLSEYLAAEKIRTNAGILALMAYGAAAGLLASASFTHSLLLAGTALCYAGFGFLLGALEMHQCKNKHVSEKQNPEGSA